MPVLWSTFETPLAAQMSAPSDISIEDFASLIIDAYIDAILTGGDSVSQPPNKITGYDSKVDALKQGFVDMVKNTFDNNVALDLSILQTALEQFWTGMQLETTGMPPGTTSTVSAVVLFQGVATPVPAPGPQTSPDAYINMMKTFFQSHLATVQCLVTAIVPGSPPVPTPFPCTYV